MQFSACAKLLAHSLLLQLRRGTFLVKEFAHCDRKFSREKLDW